MIPGPETGNESESSLLASSGEIGGGMYARAVGDLGSSLRLTKKQSRALIVVALVCALLLLAWDAQAPHGRHIVTSLGATGGSLIVADMMSMGPLAHPIMKTFRANATNASFSHQCHMSSSSHCPIESMPAGKISAVFPGGKTGCIFETSTPFLFQVIPGDSDKLILHFDDGGCCWDETTANLGACKTAVAELGFHGIFDVHNHKNPYAKYTFVVIGYCGGDVHVGDVNRPWVVPEGGQVSQRGYWNSMSAIEWAKANVNDKRLTSFIISGSSAGSLGAQVWARKLLSEFDYESAAVIADSFAGVFPDGVQGQVMQGTGLCKHDLLSQRMQPLCEAGTLDVQMVLEDTMSAFPDVAFASIDSKVDSVQIAFYELIYGTLLKGLDTSLTPQRFSGRLDDMSRRYMRHPNWVTYLVNSQNHLFLPEDIMYRTRPGSTVMKTTGAVNEALSIMGVPLSGSNVALADWLQGLPVKPGQTAKSVCRGVQQKVEAAEPPTPAQPTALGSLFGSTLTSLKTIKTTVKTSLKTSLTPLAQQGTALTGMGDCIPGLDGKMFTRPS